ncbi:MAG TPA: alkaline phosphatase, partial [Myxococcota bacterium]|nr:alkaline phosphatase [Myxococcota bacterium]
KAKALNKSTGIIATKLFTDATPAAFVSHAEDRSHVEEILQDMFRDSKPNLILGADTPLHRSRATNSSASYQFVHSALKLKDLANKIALAPMCQGHNCPYVYGGFGQYQNIPGHHDAEAGLPFEIVPESKFVELDVPHLSEMTAAALKILNKNNNGFFLMVESSNPDMIGHQNHHIDQNERMPSAISVLVREMMEIDRTIKVLENFVKENPDTLLVLTADHETGGLMVEADKTDCLGRDQCVPTVRWTSAKYEPSKPDSFARHTGVDVPLYAIGQGSERFCQEVIDNTDIPKLALPL